MSTRSRVFPRSLVLQLAGYLLLAAGFGAYGWSRVTLVTPPVPTPAIVPVVADIQPTSKPAEVQVVNGELSQVTPLPVTSGPVLGRILMYHYVRDGVDRKKDPIGYNLSVPSALFAQQIAALKGAGYQPVSMDDVLAHRGGPKAIVISFDDGYEDFYTTAKPILDQYGWKATLYIISNKIGGPYMTWDQIRALQSQGFEIGAHTMDHPDLSKLSVDAQRQQIFGSKQAIEAQLGVKIDQFCYPSGKYTADTERLVQEAGFIGATTTKPGLATAGEDPYAISRVRVSPSTTPQDLLRLLGN